MVNTAQGAFEGCGSRSYASPRLHLHLHLHHRREKVLIRDVRSDSWVGSSDLHNSPNIALGGGVCSSHGCRFWYRYRPEFFLSQPLGMCGPNRVGAMSTMSIESMRLFCSVKKTPPKNNCAFCGSYTFGNDIVRDSSVSALLYLQACCFFRTITEDDE